MEEVKSVTFTIDVPVSVEGSEATVTIIPEVRLTERFVSYLAEALKARDLELKHWTLTSPEQEKELENLPNVVVAEKD